MSGSLKSGGYDALVREAARRLAETVASYGVLTRVDLVAISGVERWPSIDFDKALECAEALGLVRRLPGDLFESRGGPEDTG